MRSRVLDLLGTFRDVWMPPERLLAEYHARWGEVNPETFRRTLTRLIATDEIEVRYVNGTFSVNENLEVRMTSDSYWSRTVRRSDPH